VDSVIQGMTGLTALTSDYTGNMASYCTELQTLIKKTPQKKPGPVEGSASIKSIEVCQDTLGPSQKIH
jgi:hypothetical protein